MTISDTNTYKVTKETLEFAQKTAVNSKDENSRKRIYEALICLRTLAEYFISEGYSINLENNLFRIIPLNEELECNDLHVNGNCIDVRTVVNDKYVLIPKTYYKYNVLPDIFAVAKYNSENNTVKFLGSIEPNQAEQERQNEKYYITEVSKLLQPSHIEEKIKQFKSINISDQNHDLYASYFIDYCDEILPEINKKALFKHLFECRECRKNFSDFYTSELIAKHSSEYPQILQDQMLNIVGAAGVDNEKYKNYEKVTIEIDKEPDKYSEDEQDENTKTTDDPLKVLYGEKHAGSEVFNSFKQKTALPKETYKKPKSVLDSVLADFSKSSVSHTPMPKSPLQKIIDDDTAETVKIDEINAKTSAEDFAKEIFYENKKEDDTDYVEEIVTPTNDKTAKNTEDNEPLVFRTKIEPTNDMEEMRLLDAPVSPDISKFANYKSPLTDVTNDDEDLILIEDDEDDNDTVQSSDRLPVDTSVINNEFTNNLNNIKTVKYEKEQTVDEKNLIHFDIEDVDIVDEKDNDKNSTETEIKYETKTAENIESNTGISDENELTLKITEEKDNNNIKTENSESEAETEDNDSIFTEIKKDNLDADLTLDGDSDEDNEDNLNIDSLLNSDLINIDNVDLSLDNLHTAGEPPVELETEELYPEIEDVITNMYDIENKRNIKTGLQSLNEIQEEADEDDEDDEIILIDDNNQPINNISRTNNEKITNITENNATAKEASELSDNNEGFVRPASVSDLTKRFMMRDNKENAENNPTDDEDDEITFIDLDTEENGNETDSYVRPTGTLTENTPEQPKSDSENNQNIQNDFGKNQLSVEVKTPTESENKAVQTAKNYNETLKQNEVKYDENGFEIEDNENDVIQKKDENQLNNTDTEEHEEIEYEEGEYEEGEYEEGEYEEGEYEEGEYEEGEYEEGEYEEGEYEEGEYEEGEYEEGEYEEGEYEEGEYEEGEYEEGEYEEGEYEEEAAANNKKNTFKKAAIIGIILLAGLGSLGGGLFYFFNKAKYSNTDSVETSNYIKDDTLSTENTKENPEQNNDNNLNMETEGIKLLADGENNQIAEQMPPQEKSAPEEENNAGPVPQFTHENKAEQMQSKDMNEAMTDAFSNNPSSLKVTKTSWGVAPYIASDAEFKTFLQTAGRTIQSTIKNNIGSVKDNTYSENTKVQIDFNEGIIQNISISKSSGSKQIDEIVLQSVKEYMSNAQMPQLSENTINSIKNANGNNSFKITFSVNF